MPYSVGGVVSGVVTALADDGRLWLDVGDVTGSVGLGELSLPDGESAQDRYAVGDIVHDLFVWQVDHDTREFRLSVRRNTPGYVDALNAHKVGDVVSATVTLLASDGGLWLDADGVIGWVGPQELSLASGESAQDRYAVGHTVDNLFVWHADRDDRILDLSVRRNAPGYVEALNAHSVGDIASATVTAFQSNGGIWLDVGDVIGSVALDELPLAEGESAQDRYAVGGTLHNLFVWQVNYRTRCLDLSVRRNAPGYVEALSAHSVGDVVSATVTLLSGNLWLDVDGVIGFMPRQELALADGESIQDRYAVGSVVRARVWQIDLEGRDVALSVRRLAPDFPEEPIELGAPIDAVIRDSRPGGTEVLVASQTVRVPHCELSLGIGEQPRFGYGDSIPVVVLALDSDGNPSALSHRRALPGWQAAVDRLAPGVVVPDAQIVPRSAVPESEDRASVNLGPVNGFVRRDELDAKQAEELMTDAPNTQYPVVVESIEANGANVIVSHVRFEERWRDLAADVSENTEIDAELRLLSDGMATFDLGSGLLGRMPFAPRTGKQSVLKSQDLGKMFPMRVTAIDVDRCHISVEHRDQWLEELIGEPESQTLEFKEVLKGDKGVDNAKEMTRQAIRTINAFLNAGGGHLIIGVHDKTREIVGLEGDPGLVADTIDKKIDIAVQILEANLEKLEPLNLLDDLSGLVEYELPVIGGKTLLVVTCQRGPHAGVVVNIGKGKQEFWVRDGSKKVEKKAVEERRAHLLLRAQRSTEATEEP